MLIDDSLAAFAEATAQRTSTPGGGAVAAYLGALGAALGAMASRFTVGRDDFADREPALKVAIEELDRLRHELVGLVDADAEAFGAVTAAYGLPRGSDDEKAARREAIQAALVGAMEVPLRTCRTAIAALDVLDELRSGVTKHLASDVAVGAHALAACQRSAWINVEINLASMKDAERVAQVRDEGAAMTTHVDACEARIVAAVMAVIS